MQAETEVKRENMLIMWL